MPTKQFPLARSLFVISLTGVIGCGLATTVAPSGTTCDEQPIRAVLHFDNSDPRKIWATHVVTGRDIAVRPRSDLGWRLDPGPPTRLLDRAGRVAGHDGDILFSACFDSVTGTFYIGPEDLPPPDRPPN